MASYEVGDKVEVFSISQRRWLKGHVSAVEGGMVSVIYTMPDGMTASKQLPELGHEHLRRQLITSSTAEPQQQQQRQQSSLASGRCKNGCGWTKFGKFPSCCTHCKGPDGPHAADCHMKNQRLASAPANAQYCTPVAVQASPTTANPVRTAPSASPTTANPVRTAPSAIAAAQSASAAVAAAAAAAGPIPTTLEETPLKWSSPPSSPRGAPVKVLVALGEKSSTELQADAVRRLERLIQHGDLSGASRAYARARHLQVDVGILQASRAQLEALHEEGEFSLFVAGKAEK